MSNGFIDIKKAFLTNFIEADTKLGHERREDKSESHDENPAGEFMAGATKAIKNDEFEATIGMSARLRKKRESFSNFISSSSKKFHKSQKS